MLPSDDVDMQVIHTLAALLPIVDHRPEASLAQSFLPGNSRSNDHKVAQQLLVPVLGFRQLAQPVTILWNDQEMRLCYG